MEMEIENKINLKHLNIPFFKRVEYYLKIFIGITTIFGILYTIGNKPINFTTYMIIMFISFGLLAFYSISRTKLYLTCFNSDSKNVEISYLDFSKEKNIITKIEEIEVKLKNTTSRSGFNCELEIFINKKKFIINNDFDWSYSEMKILFDYIKFNKKENPSEKEKFMISRIVNKLEKTS